MATADGLVRAGCQSPRIIGRPQTTGPDDSWRTTSPRPPARASQVRYPIGAASSASASMTSVQADRWMPRDRRPATIMPKAITGANAKLCLQIAAKPVRSNPKRCRPADPARSPSSTRNQPTAVHASPSTVYHGVRGNVCRFSAATAVVPDARHAVRPTLRLRRMPAPRSASASSAPAIRRNSNAVVNRPSRNNGPGSARSSRCRMEEPIGRAETTSRCGIWLFRIRQDPARTGSSSVGERPYRPVVHSMPPATANGHATRKAVVRAPR